MHVGEACYACLVEQSRRVLRQCRLSKEKEEEIMRAVEEFLAENYTGNAIPALLGTGLHRLLKSLTGCADPFREAKARSNALAQALIPMARRIIESAEDRLEATVKVALAGNLLDFGVYGAEASAEMLSRALEEKLAINHIQAFRRLIESSRRVLYLLDNAGEIALDRLLIEELKRHGLEVIAVVKSAPIINDATIEDAQQVELTHTCRVITSGSDVVGVDFKEASEELLREFDKADFIIAKGQGHFETLDEYTEKPVVFLLKAKCKSVAEQLRVPQGGSVVLVRNFE
jgi:hypothetical protein